jgi:hypothetical protein
VVTILSGLGGFTWDVLNRLKTASNQRLHRIANEHGSR